jgi:Protein of unknown function (DUF1549)/Protein of unknown function (DUF1553)
MALNSVRAWRLGRVIAPGLVMALVGALCLPGGFAQQKGKDKDKKEEKKEETPKDVPAKVPPGLEGDDADVVKTINEKLRTAWADNKVTPAPRCDDHEYIRRASLDIIGRIGTPKEIAEYMSDSADTRRPKLIERLLKHEDYAKNWANIWTVWLLTRSGAFGRGTYHEQMQLWLEDQFASNKKLNEILKALLTAEGKNSDNGAVNFILAHMGEKTPANAKDDEGQPLTKSLGQFDMVPVTARLSRLFLGIQTACAQCHDHPFDGKIKQQHFWGINAYLRQVERVGEPPMGRMMGAPPLTLRDDSNVNVKAIVTFEGRNAGFKGVRASFLDGQKIPMEADGKTVKLKGKDRREELARLIIEHPNYPKAMVNRIWAHYFGKGFVNPIDDFNEQNPVAEPELLDELGKRFRHYGFDQKRLIRWICNSEAYNLTCVANKSNEKPEQDVLFSRTLLKALTPEQLFESLIKATQPPGNVEAKKELKGKFMDALVSNFGDDEGNEVNYNGTIVQALMLMNGGELNSAIAPGKDQGMVTQLVKEQNGNAKSIITTMYLQTLNRPPTAKELDNIGKSWVLLDKNGRQIPDKDPYARYHDLLWALVNSNEFNLNH